MKVGRSGLPIGKVAASFGISPQALRNRIKRPEIQEFFSANAKGKPGKGAVFNEQDWSIAVSVDALLQAGDDWDEIANKLRGGWREDNLPESAAIVAANTQTAMHLAGRAISAEDRLAMLIDQITELNRTIHALQTEMINSERAHTHDVERIMRELGGALAGKAHAEGQLQEVRAQLQQKGQGDA